MSATEQLSAAPDPPRLPRHVRYPRAGVAVFAVVWLCFLGYGVVKLLTAGPESYAGQRLFFLAVPLGMLAELGARASPQGSTAHRVLRAAFLGLMLAGFLGLVL